MSCEHNFLGESTCEHCGASESEQLPRLRAIEAAAAELVANWDGTRDTTLADIEALRMALGSTSDPIPGAK